MGRRLFLSAVVLTFLLCAMSCGGGGGGNSSPSQGTTVTQPPPPPPPPPPPATDFSLTAGMASVTAQQGGVMQFEGVIATPLNGFQGTIDLTFSGVPAGVVASPVTNTSSSISFPGVVQSASFQIIASQTAPLGTSTVTVTGTSGNIKHTASFSLSVTPSAPFTISVSPAAISLSPANQINVQVSGTATTGTLPPLVVNVSGPNRQGLNIGYPLNNLTAGTSVSFSITTSDLLQPLQAYPLVITATNQVTNDTAMVIVPLTITIPFATNVTPTRSTFARTDASPTGMTYDPARKLLFVSVETLNEVEVLSSVDGHRIASIPVGYPAGIDIAADGSAVYVVSPFFPGVTVIDPDLLQVIRHATVPVTDPTSAVTFLQAATLSNGKVVLSPPGVLALPAMYLYDPATDSFSPFGPQTVAQFLISRSGDHSKLIGTSDLSGGFLYDVNTDTITGPTPLIVWPAAVNNDGSQIVSIADPSTQYPLIVFYDRSLNELGSLPYHSFWLNGSPPRFFYSGDGTFAYIVPDESIGVGIPTGDVVAVIDAKTFSPVGLVPSLGFGATLPFSGSWITTFALDETNMLFGAAYGGVGLLDLNSATSLSLPLLQPFYMKSTLASLLGTTQAQAKGNFSTSDSVNLYVGAAPGSPQTLPATNVSIVDGSTMALTIPKGANPGPANVTLTRSDGDFEIMPDAVSFGPTILAVDANAGSTTGGDVVKITGFGLESATVSIGSRLATVTNTGTISSAGAFPTTTLTVNTPAGSPGVVDVTIPGATSSKGWFQYAQSIQVYPITGALDGLAYDAPRNQLYASNEDHDRVEVFDLSSRQFKSPIAVRRAPTSVALTPDGKLLGVLNSGDATVSVIDLASMKLLSNYPVLTAADQNQQLCGGAALLISPVALHRMAVSVNCAALLGEGTVHLVDLDTGALSCSGVTGCAANGADLVLGRGAPILASSADGTRLFFTNNFAVGVLDFTANTLTSTGGNQYQDCAADTEGDIFATLFGTYDAQANRVSLMAYEPYASSAGSQSLDNVFGEKLSAAGSLLYYPQKSAVDLFDVHTGRLRLHLSLPDPIPFDMYGMAVDESGAEIFLISNTGITVAELSEVPLSLAKVKPSIASVGNLVTLRGSGFKTGATVMFGTKEVTATFVDANTLQAQIPSVPSGPARVTVKNPNGEEYSFDAAVVVQ